MPNATDILQSIIDDLHAELAPLNSIYHNFAKYRVEAGFDSVTQKGFYLEVHAPDHVRIFVPTSYQSFPVHFVEWEPSDDLDIDGVIDCSEFMHFIYE